MKKLSCILLTLLLILVSCGKEETAADAEIIIKETLQQKAETPDTEKKAIGIDDYAQWEALRKQTVSESGRYIHYNITPQRGDTRLVLHTVETAEKKCFERAEGATLFNDESCLVFKKVPRFEVSRRETIDKVKKDKKSKDSLCVYDIAADSLQIIPRVKSYYVPKEGPWLALLLEKPLPVKVEKDTVSADTTETDSTLLADTTAIDTGKVKVPEPEKKAKEKIREKGTPFWVWDPLAADTLILDYAKSFTMSENGRRVLTLTELKGDPDSIRLTIIDPEKKKTKVILEGAGEAKSFRFDKKGEQLAFLFSDDTTKVKTFDLYYWAKGRKKAKKYIDETSEGIREGWSVSSIRFPRFSDSGKRIFFGTAPIPVEEPEDTLTKNEKVGVDIWSWHDPLLQTQQVKELNREKKRNYVAYCRVGSHKVIQLADETVTDISFEKTWDEDLAFGAGNVPYRQLISWESLDYYDFYIVDMKTGEKDMILEKKSFEPQMSPRGKYVVWFDHEDSQWHSVDVTTRETRELTSDLDVVFYSETHDRAFPPDPYGLAGWGLNDRYVFLYDRYDIWKMDLSGEKAPLCVTDGKGRDRKVIYRYGQLDKDNPHVPVAPIVLSAFNEKTKKAGYATVNMYEGSGLKELIYTDHKYQDLKKAKHANVLIWRRGDYRTYPDLWISDLNFETRTRISALNPQQKNYRWADVELVEWTNSKGDELQGMLYIPEDLDMSRKHPMIIYYYEKYSDYFHQYFTPRPSYSTVNKTTYPSNGYILFIPDIVYEVGHPGKSGFDCVDRGVDMLLEKYDFIDGSRIGLQGQSWGGYQTAYFITQSDRYAAAMAGAPVSNMTSAYGGIRWGTGLSRMMQYEEGQSRIGGTLWDSFDLYVENSPVFFADKITTPLLMMHNDNDGAVPFTQGIEMMAAMRRLQKPAWMLVYNNDSHNLNDSHWGNRIDLTIRMKQFFDHYLKDEPMPRWMKEGVSALEKGKDMKYELSEEE